MHKQIIFITLTLLAILIGKNAVAHHYNHSHTNTVQDTTPPAIDSAILISPNKLAIYFDTPLTTVSAQTNANYSVDNGIGFATIAAQDTINTKLVHLLFNKAFLKGQSYTLHVTGVQDQAGNTTINATYTFLFFIPERNDIVINEIMADISPAPAGLPAYEYIELYNRTAYAAQLQGWKISDASTSTTIPDIIIPANSYYILTSTAGASAFGGVPCIGVPSLPSLNDTGDDLSLKDADGNIISIAFYRADWYNNSNKDAGGWALEQIDPDNSCTGKPNWNVSADNSGGTPGRQNSVNTIVIDTLPPRLTRITVLSMDSIQLFFNKNMDSNTLLPLIFYSVDNGIGNPITVAPIAPDYTSVLLKMQPALNAGIIYKLSIHSIKDCMGNTISPDNNILFAVPEPAETNDIVINEVMFDPKDQGVEWVEIYNRSQKIIDLKEISLCSKDNMGILKEISPVVQDGYLIFPKNYIVLSTDAHAIKQQYFTGNPEGFIDMGTIPFLNNDSDYIVLINGAQKIIDQLYYTVKWHFPLLNDTKGVSLERVSYESPTQNKNNWYSAASTKGGATPAYQNSEYTGGESENEITISPEVFSPDEDGYNDLLSIAYSFDKPDMVGNVQIYDERGELVQTLVQNELLATSGSFFWNGTTKEMRKARIGIYIVYFEVFDSNGNVKKYKKSCVLGGKL